MPQTDAIHKAQFQMIGEDRHDLYWLKVNGKRTYVIEAENDVEFEAPTPLEAITAYLEKDNG